MAPITRLKGRAIEHHTSSYLGKFPPEILNQIIDHLDKPSLKNLRLCSRLLKPLVEPRIYEKIVLNNGLERLRNAKSIVSDTRFRHYVKEVENIWSLTGPKWPLSHLDRISGQYLLVKFKLPGNAIPDSLRAKVYQICENDKFLKYPYIAPRDLSAVLKEFTIAKSRNLEGITSSSSYCDPFEFSKLICLNTKEIVSWQELKMYHNQWFAQQIGIFATRLSLKYADDREVKVLKDIYATCHLLEKVSYSLNS